MTLCTPPCPAQDYCIHFGCPFTREPESSFTDKHGGPAHDLEVRIGAAGKGPRLNSSVQAEPSRGGCSADSIQSSGVGPDNHQPGSMTRGGRIATPAPSGRARDRAICPADSRFTFGCAHTGSEIHIMRGQSANSKSEPRARFWIAGSGVTAAPHSNCLTL